MQDFTKQEEQVLALAGIFQCCQLVDHIASRGQADAAALQAAVDSLLNTDPGSTIEIYGSLEKLRPGIELVNQLLSGKQSGQGMHAVRYAMAVLHLEAKLQKNPQMLDTIGRRLQHAKSQAEHFGTLHENVFEGLAGIYMDTISTFKLRIQVNGAPNLLQNSLNAAKIRTLLFAAIRSAVLWRQLGGRRWHFLFKKQGIAKTAQALLQR
ncbi:MAG: high frequency lysogenization protein HflD [Oleiphilaceae bacterium]|nr:high frequency lysogenization protein HflD [Oleiphilaceae bacterium]